MSVASLPALSRAERRRLVVRGLLRALAATTVLLALYFRGPFTQVQRMPVGLALGLALLALLLVSGWQLRAITRDAHPAVRAIEALAVTVPLFLLLFAASYFVLAQDDPSNFNTPALTRVDSLYFTITTFATVGFGDIAATSENARLLVSGQIVLDLLVLGLGIRVFIGAVQRGRQRQDP
jgi:voltage-gated potassium channel